MNKVTEIKGLIYNLKKVNIADVLCPPYDVVTPEQREKLIKRSIYSAIQIELPESKIKGVSKYERARQLVDEFLEKEILIKEDKPKIYGYEITDTKTQNKTLGFLGGIYLSEEPGDILPHEKTIEKDKTDRYELLKATMLNTSPIWLLSLSTGIEKLLVSSKNEAIVVLDDQGNLHEFWDILDEQTLSELKNLVGQSPLVIADGHHRFSTARQFKETFGKSINDANFVFALVAELSEHSLNISPIYRIIKDADFTELENKFLADFELKVSKDYSSLKDLEPLVSSLTDFEIAIISDKNYRVYEPRLEPKCKLPTELLEEIFSGANIKVKTYAHSLREAIDHAKNDLVALSTRPIRVEDIRSYATNNLLMPPKSTYFAPKPLTGFIFRTLES